jgi:hypothetical protein
VVDTTGGGVVVVVGVVVVDAAAVVVVTVFVVAVVVVLVTLAAIVIDTTILAHKEPSVRTFGDESARAPNSVGPWVLSRATLFSEYINVSVGRGEGVIGLPVVS